MTPDVESILVMDSPLGTVVKWYPFKPENWDTVDSTEETQQILKCRLSDWGQA